MKNLKRILTVCTCLMLSAISLQAQFTIEITDEVTNNWAAKEGSCSLSEVAEALGFSSAEAFATELQASLEATQNGTTPSIVITCENTSGVQTSDYSANYDGITYGCFWLTAEGKATTWGNSCVVWSCIKWNLDNDQLIGGMGQYPNTCTVGTTYTTTSILTYNGTSVEITIKLTIEETPEEDGPAWKDLEIVGSETCYIVQDAHPNGLWYGDEFKFDAAKAIEALGMTKDEFAEQFSSIIWAYAYDSNTEYLADKLTQKSTANPIGWWFTPSYNEETEENDGVCYACDYGKDDAFYTEYFAFVDSIMAITGYLGQSYSGFQGGEHRWTEVYLVNGTKAYKLILDLQINSVQTYDFSEMTSVGTEDHTFIQPVRGDYSVDVDSLQIDSICELLGCDKSQVSFKCLIDESKLSSNYTANAPGFWMGEDGQVVDYGNGHLFFIEYDATNGAIRVGQNPGQLTEGNTYAGVFLLCYQDKYYRLNVTLQIPKRNRLDPSQFTNVANYEYEVQIVPSQTDWNTDTYTEKFDLDAMKELLGNPMLTVYGDTLDADGNAALTMDYTCTPYPGFWFSDDGHVAKYSAADTRIALTFKENYWEVIQNPAKNEVGQEYHIRQYVVADSTGNMATFDIYITFVETVVKATDVGEETVAINLGDGETEVYQNFDTTTLFEKLGCTEEQFLENGIIQTAISASRFGGADLCDDAEGFWYDADGNVLDPSNQTEMEQSLFCVKFVSTEESEDATTQLRAYAAELPEGDNTYTTRIAFIYNNKRYIVNVSLMNEETYSGISTIATDAVRAKGIYDLSGRRVSAPAKGLYIIDGKKVYVK